MQNYNARKYIAAGIIEQGNKILIAQRAKKDSLFGKWEFPGGKLEGDETPEETLKRELNEEFGIVAEVGEYVCSSFFEHNGYPYEMKAFRVPSFKGELELREHSQIKWVAKEELLSYEYPDADLPIIEALLKADTVTRK